MPKSPYIHPGYKPNYQKEVIATYRLESPLPLAEAATHIAAESSIGTWTKLETLKDKTLARLGPKIFYLDNKKKLVKIAYPLPLFELGNITQLLSALAGNIFSMKVVTNLRLLDIQLPKKYLDSFSGPAFGIEGVRKYLKIHPRPIVGSIIKPKVGLSAKEQAKLAYDIWKNGVDLVKDDENLTDMEFNKFEDRVREVMKLKKQVEKETGEKKVYVFNVTGPADMMLQRAKLVKKYGGKVVMIDLVVAGLDNIQFLRQQNLGLILHGHRAGHSMFTKNPRHGLSMFLLAKLTRLVGIDQLHTGTVVGKMEGTAEEVTMINLEMEEDWFGVNKEMSDWSEIKPVLPIASGGLHPGLVEKLTKILGTDLIINFGGGLHGHPDGSIAGAMACRQAVDAVMKKIPARKYAETHPELKRALEYWK